MGADDQLERERAVTLDDPAAIARGDAHRTRGPLRGVALPAGLMPRLALGYLFFPLLAILKSADLTVVKDSEVDEALVALDAQAGALGPGRPAAENEAKRLALALGSRLPVIYGGPLTGAVAYRWKTDLAENAKTFAAAGTLP